MDDATIAVTRILALIIPIILVIRPGLIWKVSRLEMQQEALLRRIQKLEEKK